MRQSIFLKYSLLTLCITFFSSCSIKTYEAPWYRREQTLVLTDTSELFSVAKAKYETAGSKDSLLASLESFKEILEIDPGNKRTLTYICNQYILLGTAYTLDRSLKYKYFQEAMVNCELAMYANPRI